MPTEAEIKEVVEWCESLKKSRNSIFVIDKNPFSSKFDWARNIINIEIDRPLASAAKNSLVYDSVMKRLYKYNNFNWVALNLPGVKR